MADNGETITPRGKLTKRKQAEAGGSRRKQADPREETNKHLAAIADALGLLVKFERAKQKAGRTDPARRPL